jgi:hypothetical protein
VGALGAAAIFLFLCVEVFLCEVAFDPNTRCVSLYTRKVGIDDSLVAHKLLAKEEIFEMVRAARAGAIVLLIEDA